MIFYFLFPQQLDIFSHRWGKAFYDPGVHRRLIEVNLFGLQFLKHPIFGNNLGTLLTYEAPDWSGKFREITTTGSHTEMVYWLYTLGIVGTGLFTLILLLIFKMGIFNIKTKTLPKEYRSTQKAVLIIIFSFIIVSFSTWIFRRWIMVPSIVMMFAYTRNLHLYSLRLSRKYKERKDLIYS